MSEGHPKLCLRPRPRAGLNRPTLHHPVLGHLAYINRNGGWWQGTSTMAGAAVRLDLQQPANPTADALESAAEMLLWTQQNEAAIRSQIGQHLAAGDYRSNLRRQADPEPIVDAVTLLGGLQPTMVVLWQSQVDLRYSCDLFPEASRRGAHQIGVSLGQEKSVDLVTLDQLDLFRRAEYLLDRPVPADLTDFVDSMADQLVAKAAAGGLHLNRELREILQRVIEKFEEQRAEARSAPLAAYLASLLSVLREIGTLAETVIERVAVDLRVRHQAEKRMPFKQKLVFAPGDRARFDGSGPFPRVVLFDLDAKGDSPEAFAGNLQSRLQEASAWLARQCPALFQALRDAGFQTEVFASVFARIGEDSVNHSMPAEFLTACGRLGLALSTATSNSATWE